MGVKNKEMCSENKKIMQQNLWKSGLKNKKNLFTKTIDLSILVRYYRDSFSIKLLFKG